LLTKVTIPKETNQLQWTHLHEAALEGMADCVFALLDAGMSSDVRDHDGNTPLHKAAESGSITCVDILLQRGASLNARNVARLTPYELAIMSRQYDCADYLSKKKTEAELLLEQLALERQEELLKEEEAKKT